MVYANVKQTRNTRNASRHCRKGKRYLQEERKFIIRCDRKNKSARQIALRLGRSERAILYFLVTHKTMLKKDKQRQRTRQNIFKRKQKKVRCFVFGWDAERRQYVQNIKYYVRA